MSAAGRRYYRKMEGLVQVRRADGPLPADPRGMDSKGPRRHALAGGNGAVRVTKASSVHVDLRTRGRMEILANTDPPAQRTSSSLAVNRDRLLRGFLASLNRDTARRQRERRDAMANGIYDSCANAAKSPKTVGCLFDLLHGSGSREGAGLSEPLVFRLSARPWRRTFCGHGRPPERWIACAINFIGSDTLFRPQLGRSQHNPLPLHYEVCYYQAFDFADSTRHQKSSSGAQRRHKIARGYLPQDTYYAH